MRALIFDRFGGPDVLRWSERPAPAAEPGHVVVAVAARSINVIDSRVRNGSLGPLVNKTFPKIPGCDLAGTVTEIGADVEGLAVGDRVFGATAPFKGGSFAELVALPAAQLARLPDGIDLQSAAALPIAGLAALAALRDLGRLKQGQRLLVHGATGAVGLYAIQIAKGIGASVTAVAGAGLQTAASFGADELIDYRKQDAARFGRAFDVIINASGRLPWAVGRQALTPAGRLIEPSPTIPLFIGAMAANLMRRRKHLPLATAPKRENLEHLRGLVTEGRLRSTIAATYTFERAIEAFIAMERGGVVGKLIVTS